MSYFVHLRTHTEYSISESILRVNSMVKRAADYGMPALALTDCNNVFGFVKFYKACLKNGIKPIIGCEFDVINDISNNTGPKPSSNNQKVINTSSKLILFAQNNAGYLNLIKLISRAYTDKSAEYYNATTSKSFGPVINKSWILESACSDGMIALSGGMAGEIGQCLLNQDLKQARSCAAQYSQVFANRFYCEVSRVHASSTESQYNSSIIELADELQLPLVAVNNNMFLEPEDYEAHEARVCIGNGYQLSDPKRPKDFTQEQYFKSSEQMLDLFKDIPDAIDNTLQIAQRCTVELTLDKNFLPDFPTPNNIPIADYLKQVSFEGLEQRIIEIKNNPDTDDNKVNESYKQELTNRLNIELDVINTMGFPGYFLIVADFISWAKNNGVPVGPGRGSGAGSLVAYCLGITNLNPLDYDLLFERFLNPERVSMPDFDIDFCMEGRDRVIEYVAQKYGRDAVSQIITFGTMAAKAVVRDVGRALGYSYGFVDKIAKMIPFEIGITLDKALDQEPNLQVAYDTEDDVKEIIDLAKKLEGVTRNVGKHAGGVVISPGALTNFTAVYCEEGSQSIVSQFDKDDVEAIGLVKFDFLGLRTLTIINWAVTSINTYLKDRKKQDKVLNIDNISLTDSNTFSLLKACNTTAVFQLESSGMKDLINRLQPDCFEDIVALVALFRPGPLQSGMVDDFIDRKHGRAAVEYPHPDLENILKPTYGVILYQEQVMQIAQVLAGYSLGAADLLRRAMGKKKPEEMAKQREIFTKGALANNIDEKTATYIFDLMEKFAGYGFNKSHSAAYALVSYQTAWLKAHFKEHFYGSSHVV